MKTYFLKVPIKTIISTVNAADHKGTLLSSRHEGFRETVESFKVDWYECLAFFATIRSTRFLAITSGLAAGVYFMPNKGDFGYFAYLQARVVRPIIKSKKNEFCISYSSEDRNHVLRLKKDLAEKDITCFLIDVAEDPEDAIWFLRFKTAMASSTYFIPVLSKYYLSRQGSTQEFEEAWALVETQESCTNWYPIVPLLTDTYTKLSDPNANKIVSRLPGFKIDNDNNYNKALKFLEGLYEYNRGEFEGIELYLSQVAIKKRNCKIENKNCMKYTFSSDLCFSNDVIICDDALRIVKKTIISNPKRIPVPKNVNIDVELRVENYIRENRFYEAICYASREIIRAGADVSQYISLAKAFELGGYETYALICLKEARQGLNSGHTVKTINYINDTITKIEGKDPTLSTESVSDILKKFASEEQLLSPSCVKLKKYVSNELEAEWERIDGIKQFFSKAGDFCREGSLNKAEAIMIAAFYYTVTDENRARSLYLAAKVALSNERISHSIDYLLIGLDYQPNHEEMRLLLQDALEYRVN